MSEIAPILVVLGTRPEAIKLAPVIAELRRRNDHFTVVTINSGQHKEILHDVLRHFDIVPEIVLDVMHESQTLALLSARLLESLDTVFAKYPTASVMVQGDTATAMNASLAAYYRKMRVIHIEAGLRTYHRFHPFPEELFRRIITHTTDLHFSPTERARQNLLREGVSSENIYIVGNTVLDALSQTLGRIEQDPSIVSETVRSILSLSQNKKIILVTVHRRENHGEPFSEILRALAYLAEKYHDCEFLFPLHPNPNIREAFQRSSASSSRIHVTEPLGYAEIAFVMKHSWAILTDSGGIQEESPFLGVPTLVLREETDRPEAVEHNSAILVGTSENEIVSNFDKLYHDSLMYGEMSQPRMMYGDAHAAERIVSILLHSHKNT